MDNLLDMVDKIIKQLNKLRFKEKLEVKRILERIRQGDFANLDIQKLKDREDIYRVRKGSIRIIFYMKKSSTNILTIERRSDNTYKST